MWVEWEPGRAGGQRSTGRECNYLCSSIDECDDDFSFELISLLHVLNPGIIIIIICEKKCEKKFEFFFSP
jgi:hypothetical protein